MKYYSTKGLSPRQPARAIDKAAACQAVAGLSRQISDCRERFLPTGKRTESHETRNDVIGKDTETIMGQSCIQFDFSTTALVLRCHIYIYI
jgi:hypothetical protein